MAVAAGFLPIQPTQTLDHEQVRVARGGICLELRAVLRRHARRYDDFDLWITLRNGFVGWLAVIGAIGHDLTYFVFD
ncbi:MAG TPA: hypothetical protein VIK56_04315, partial [Rhodoferax sp.]